MNEGVNVNTGAVTPSHTLTENVKKPTFWDRCQPGARSRIMTFATLFLVLVSIAFVSVVVLAIVAEHHESKETSEKQACEKIEGAYWWEGDGVRTDGHSMTTRSHCILPNE